MSEFNKLLKCIPCKWAKNGFLLGTLWVLPFLILSYFEETTIEGGMIAAFIRIFSTIILPLTFLGFCWGLLESMRLRKYIADLTDNDQYKIPKQYLLSKICEGALMGFLYANLQAFFGYVIYYKNYDLILIYNNYKPNYAYVVIGSLFGCIISYVMKRKLKTVAALIELEKQPDNNL